MNQQPTVNDIDWIDAIVSENRSISVTKRLPVSAGHVSQAPITYHVRCKAHDTTIEIDALQAEIVEDSITFCRRCLNGDPSIERKIDPLAFLLASNLQRVKAGASIVEFVEGLDL